MKKNQIIYKIFDKTFKYSGLKNLYLKNKKNKNKCPVLHYHSLNPNINGISKNLFEEHIKYLSSNYNIVTLKEALQKVINNCSNGDELVITFDDGYEDNLTKAFPILSKYGGAATIFITTGLIGRRYLGQKMLNRNQIVELAQNGIEIGSHAVNHINLTTILEDQLKNELVESKSKLENIIGEEVSSFCYPYGRYDIKVVDMCKKIGYKSACTLFHDFYIEIEKLLEIPRLTVDYYDTVKQIQSKIDGDRHWVKTFYKIYYPDYKKYRN